MNLYVGNLSYETTEDELIALFGEFGTVDKATVISDRESGRSKGFGFVEMADKAAGEAAISNLDGNEVKGRNLRVNEAKPKND